MCIIEKQEIMSRKTDNLVSRVIVLQCWLAELGVVIGLPRLLQGLKLHL